MDLFEKINRSFGTWYEGLFGGADDVRPKDILRRILAAMEDHRKEGFDNKVYVPNQYVLEIHVDDEEEKEYLLSFLDRDELEAAIRRYCQQNHYHIRGPLDFTIKEVEEGEEEARKRAEKVRVLCRYNTKVTGPEPAPPARTTVITRTAAPSPAAILPEIPFEERTMAGASEAEDDGGTVPAVESASLVVYAPDRTPFRYTIARGAVTIGRSPRAGNHLVIESDGQISKRHARIELDANGRFTLYDQGSTNGTKVNGRRVDSRILNDGDEITLGTTRLTFQQSRAPEDAVAANGSAATAPTGRVQGTFGGAAAALRKDASGSPAAPSRVLRPRTARLVLMTGDQDVDDFLLASETAIGRGVTNDIVLPDRSIATRHACVVNEGDSYTLEGLVEAGYVTTLNGAPLPAGHPVPLRPGDRIGLGDLALRFEN